MIYSSRANLRNQADRPLEKEINVTHHLCPPELTLTTILIGFAICLTGCSSSYTISSAGRPHSEYGFQEMNEELHGRHVTIDLKDRMDISAKEVNISDDSVSWVDASTADKTKVAMGQLRRISFKNHFVGGMEGLGFGLVGAGGLGALVGQIAVGNDGEWGSGAGAFFGLILGGGAGTIVGLTSGLIVGHSYKYEFPKTEQSDSSQNGK